MTHPSVTLGELAHHLDAAREWAEQEPNMSEFFRSHLVRHIEQAQELYRRAARELEARR